MKRIALLFFVIFLIIDSEKLVAQLVIENNMTVEELVDEVFVGIDIITDNIKFNGLDANQFSTQVSYFNSENSNIPILSGILLATGNSNVAVGPNNSGGAGSNEGGTYQDDDLNAIATASTNNAAVLEFDFIPATDSFSINYVFASEEYNEYVCSSFNDVFGIFISGPGFSGPYQYGAENIAIIMGVDFPEPVYFPVSINNINNGDIGILGSSDNCTEEQLNNSEYFNDNEINQNINSTQYDGFTVKLHAAAKVIPGLTYHIKIAIADAGDAIIDSGVFLKEGSLGSLPEQLLINEFMASNDSWNIPGETEPELQPDWIEIYNAGDTTIDMGGWYLSDDFGDIVKYQLPTNKPELTTIPANGYLLLLCDSLDNSDGALHTNFKLDSGGQDIVISNDGVTIIDGGSYCDTGCYFPNPGTDNSSGRSTDGANDWKVFLKDSDFKPTPGSANGVVVSVISYSKDDFAPLSVYPNPAIGNEVNFNKIVNIQVYNLAGQRLFVDNDVSRLNVDQFDSGLYLIQTDEGELVKLIIK